MACRMACAIGASGERCWPTVAVTLPLLAFLSNDTGDSIIFFANGDAAGKCSGQVSAVGTARAVCRRSDLPRGLPRPALRC